jgi:plasmid stabilization system protein ParE
MTREVRFEPEASDELDHAALWYEGRSAGLGMEFLSAVDRAVTMLRRWPHAALIAIDLPEDLTVRRAPVVRCPYRVVYMETLTALCVLAIAHDSRRPSYWVGRLRKRGSSA